MPLAALTRRVSLPLPAAPSHSPSPSASVPPSSKRPALACAGREGSMALSSSPAATRVPRLGRQLLEAIRATLAQQQIHADPAAFDKLLEESKREAALAARANGVDDAAFEVEFERRSQRRAAILVPLLNVDGQASLLYTRRSGNVGTHKHQVSFPGGHIDEGESVEAAAVRELCEEILHGQDELRWQLTSRGEGGGELLWGSEDALRIEVLGTGPVVRAITGTLCTCVVCFLSGDIVDSHGWTRNEDEVDHVFTATIAHLQDIRGEEDLRGRTLPCFDSDHFPTRIWGLTAILTDALLRTTLQPAAEELALSQESSPSISKAKY
mmetsp:Transcript_13252/g.34057  ORF Transcript_13252/g.34057 Transcript_13252/m.34057 type:complete len:325 (+) Transcript_13252:132-1106(+)